MKFKHKQTGTDRNYCIIEKFIYQIGNLEVRNRQEQTGTDRNRQEKLLHHNYFIIKKFLYQIGNLEVRNRQDQTGSDRNRQDYKSDIENYCIIIIEL